MLADNYFGGWSDIFKVWRHVFDISQNLKEDYCNLF